MRSVFQVLLLLAISMMVTVSTNAHEQCEIDPSAMESVCPSGLKNLDQPCTSFFSNEAAACLIATSVVVDMQCQNCVLVKHTRYLTVVHPTYGYSYCSIRQNDENEQSIMCTLNDFGLF